LIGKTRVPLFFVVIIGAKIFPEIGKFEKIDHVAATPFDLSSINIGSPSEEFNLPDQEIVTILETE
jgi:hypothetical protein